MQQTAQIINFPGTTKAAKTKLPCDNPYRSCHTQDVRTQRGDFWAETKQYPLAYIAELVRCQIRDLHRTGKIPNGDYCVVENSTKSQETLNIVIRSMDVPQLFEVDSACADIDQLIRKPHEHLNSVGRRTVSYLDIVLNLYNRRVIDQTGTAIISRYSGLVTFRHDFIFRQLCRETAPPTK